MDNECDCEVCSFLRSIDGKTPYGTSFHLLSKDRTTAWPMPNPQMLLTVKESTAIMFCCDFNGGPHEINVAYVRLLFSTRPKDEAAFVDMLRTLSSEIEYTNSFSSFTPSNTKLH